MKKFKAAFKKEMPFFLMMPALVWQVLFFYIPIGLVIILSVLRTTQIGAIRFTLSHYAPFFAWPFFAIIGRSLILAIVTSFLSLLFCYPVAYFISFCAKRFKRLLLFCLVLPFFTSLLIQVFAWFFLLEREGVINSVLLFSGIIREPLTLLNNNFAIYLVMIYCYLPFMIFPIYTILEKINPLLAESSADLGASPWQTFLRVTFPLSLPGIKTGLFLVFIPAFGEFVVPGLMGGNKQFYVGSLIVHYFLAAQNEYAGAAFTVISCVALISATLLLHLILKHTLFGTRNEL